MNYTGLIIGIAAFFCIGIFHPIVIKAEYYCSKRCWWCFLLSGVVFAILSLLTQNDRMSIILGIVAFCCLWSIWELVQQERRVLKGWFPKNPKRKIPYPDEAVCQRRPHVRRI